jgi:CBS domain containing-hemolysin-like protein
MGDAEGGIDLFSCVVAATAMLVTIVLSAFFSASEAALFSLTANQRQKLGLGRVSLAIDSLLLNPTKLLSTILLCNLAVNITYFSCSNVIASEISEKPGWETASYVFSVGSLVLLILVSELLPKCIGVLAPIKVSLAVALPMSFVNSITGYLAIGMNSVSDICRRLIFPGLKPETVLDSSDLERAIELSETDSQLRDLEKGILQNILQLSNIEAHEWMHPKSQFSFGTLPLDPPTVTQCIEDMQANEFDDQSHLLLITSSQENEIIATATLDDLMIAKRMGLVPKTQSVLFFPWCATLAQVFQLLLTADKRHGVVVNERGETIGVILFEDLIEATFATFHDRINPMGELQFSKSGEMEWIVDGKARIRKLEKAMDIKLPDSREATIAGVVQNQLRRLAHIGDRVQWGDYSLEVTSIPQRGDMLIRLTGQQIEMPELVSEDGE